jgi:hypothetical protein
MNQSKPEQRRPVKTSAGEGVVSSIMAKFGPIKIDFWVQFAHSKRSKRPAFGVYP